MILGTSEQAGRRQIGRFEELLSRGAIDMCIASILAAIILSMFYGAFLLFLWLAPVEREIQKATGDAIERLLGDVVSPSPGGLADIRSSYLRERRTIYKNISEHWSQLIFQSLPGKTYSAMVLRKIDAAAKENFYSVVSRCMQKEEDEISNWMAGAKRIQDAGETSKPAFDINLVSRLASPDTPDKGQDGDCGILRAIIERDSQILRRTSDSVAESNALVFRNRAVTRLCRTVVDQIDLFIVDDAVFKAASNLTERIQRLGTNDDVRKGLLSDLDALLSATSRKYAAENGDWLWNEIPFWIKLILSAAVLFLAELIRRFVAGLLPVRLA